MSSAMVLPPRRHCRACDFQWADNATHCCFCDQPGVDGYLPELLFRGYRNETYTGANNHHEETA
jgi:hypothetical protein